MISNIIMDYIELASELLEIKTSRARYEYDKRVSQILYRDAIILVFISRHDTVHPKDISDAFVIATARVSVILNHFEEEGLIERIPDDSDNRQTLLRLSENGKKVAQEHRDKLVRYIASRLEKMGPADARKLIELQRIFFSSDE